MQTTRFRAQKAIRAAYVVVTLAMAAGGWPAHADDLSARFTNAIGVLNELTSSHDIQTEEIASADCVAIIPGLKKGAAVVGISYGKGFISCRNGDHWSAPGAITLGGGSLGVQLGGEKIDIVILSLDKQYRSKLLSDRFTFGSDASAAWGNGKTAHGDPNAKFLFFGKTKGVFAGFDLDGATLEPDHSSIKILYNKAATNAEIVTGTETPAAAQTFLSKLTSLAHGEAASASGSRSN
jgi:lipid-binding SYLF domain-containing protein